MAKVCVILYQSIEILPNLFALLLISLSFLYLPLSHVSTSCVFCSSHLRNATRQARKSEINDH